MSWFEVITLHVTHSIDTLIKAIRHNVETNWDMRVPVYKRTNLMIGYKREENGEKMIYIKKNNNEKEKKRFPARARVSFSRFFPLLADACVELYQMWTMCTRASRSLRLVLFLFSLPPPFPDVVCSFDLRKFKSRTPSRVCIHGTHIREASDALKGANEPENWFLTLLHVS